jgi:hypothetical protein
MQRRVFVASARAPISTFVRIIEAQRTFPEVLVSGVKIRVNAIGAIAGLNRSRSKRF